MGPSAKLHFTHRFFESVNILCPACARANEEVLLQLEKEYIGDINSSNYSATRLLLLYNWSMRSYLEKHRLLYGHIGAIIALIVAVIYFVVIPGEVLEASGMQKLVLLYGHSLCWVLLSIASYLW